MRLEKVKRFIADIIEPKKKANVISIIYNILMSILILASCAFVVVDLLTPEDNFWNILAGRVELIAVIVFASEYVLKLFVSEVLYEGQGWFKSKISYITSFDSFIDIICILSILLNQIPKEFAALRLLKLVKLTRLVKLKDAIDELREQGEGESQESGKSKGIRHRIYEIIAKDKNGDVASKIYDVVALVIILLSTATIVLDTFAFPEPVERAIFISEVVFTCFFVVEYLLRIWTADFEYPDSDKEHAKMRYIFSLMAIIDLLAILPVFFTFSPDAQASLPQAVAVLKIFKIFKVARLLKMSRYLTGINMFLLSVRAKKKQIFFSIIVLIFLLTISSIIMYSFENAAGNEDFKNGFSGFAYMASWVAGMEDDSMQIISTGGKIMMVVMMLIGGCVIGVPIGIVSGEFEKMVQETTEQSEEEKDVFEEFSSKLTNEQKMEIIAKYHDQLEKTEELK